jgi:hypothetical protein
MVRQLLGDSQPARPKCQAAVCRSRCSVSSYARPDEFSRLRFRVHGEKRFEIRWDKAASFKVVHDEPDDWERSLRAWPAPIPI